MPQPNQHTRHMPIYREAILRMTKNGESARATARELGISERTVARHRVALGIAKKPAPRLSPEERVRINEMLDDGAPIAEIARTIGRPPGNLWKRYKGQSTADAMPGSIKLRKQLGLLLDGNPNPGRCIV